MIKMCNLLLWVHISIIPVFAQVKTYQFSSESKISISGTSNLSDWTIEVKKISGHVEMRNAVSRKTVLEKGDSFENVELRIDVRSMESGRGTTMDNRAHESLKGNEHPEIIFTSRKSVVKGSVNKQQGVFELFVVGDIQVAGITKPIELLLEGKKNGNDFIFSGSKLLKMTDFDIKPPTAMFGQIVAGDEVIVKFEDLILIVN